MAINGRSQQYRPLGGWLDKPADLQPELQRTTGADVVIVGGGFAGLSTALEFRARGAKVIVLEREFAGFGASGRNAGYLAGAMGLEFEMFLKHVGHEGARKIAGFYDEGVRYVESKLGEYGIDCDYYPSGIIRAGVHRAQEHRVRENLRLCTEFGSPAHFLDENEMRARGIPPAFLFASYAPLGGTLDPGKYVLGLRRAALRAGVELYENTAVLSYEEGAMVKMHTARGTASAPVVVFATNAYTPGLGLLANKVIPMQVSAMETEPLSAAQLAALGWPRREGIVTAHWTMESHRLTARDTLVLTTKRIRYPYGSNTKNVPDLEAYAALEVALQERFPSLRGLGIRSFWSGYVSIAGDALPVVGETGSQANILYTAGCSGHGVGTQSLMGLLLAQRICGSEHPLLAALRHTPPSMLPEPLRWCLINGILGVANLLDGRVNGKVNAAGMKHT
jgi:glycine/D-amino acid oxidase-like deaminating enzyme